MVIVCEWTGEISSTNGDSILSEVIHQLILFVVNHAVGFTVIEVWVTIVVYLYTYKGGSI